MNPKKIEKNLLIADNNSVVRFGLKQLLPKHQIAHIEEVDNCQDLLALIESNNFTHLIIDYYLEKGDVLKVLKLIRAKNKEIVIMMYSANNLMSYERLISAGLINVFVDKEVELPVLKKQLKKFIDIQKNLDSVQDITKAGGNPFLKLSQRQQVVMKYLLEGYSTKEISSKMDIKNNTVSTMKAILFQKLGVNSLVDLIHLTNQYNS